MNIPSKSLTGCQRGGIPKPQSSLTLWLAALCVPLFVLFGGLMLVTAGWVSVLAFHKANFSRALLGTMGSPLPAYLFVNPHLLWLPSGNLTQHAASPILTWEE